MNILKKCCLWIRYNILKITIVISIIADIGLWFYFCTSIGVCFTLLLIAIKLFFEFKRIKKMENNNDNMYNETEILLEKNKTYNTNTIISILREKGYKVKASENEIEGIPNNERKEVSILIKVETNGENSAIKEIYYGHFVPLMPDSCPWAIVVGSLILIILFIIKK